MWMGDRALLLAALVHLVAASNNNNLARDMTSQRMAMEVDASGETQMSGGSASAPAAEAAGADAAAAPAAEEYNPPGLPVDVDSKCADKMANCRARCVLMLEYYITDVSSKFDGLELVSVPETDDAGQDLFYKTATQPLFNEAAFLYCGIQRCFDSLCSNACGEDKGGYDTADFVLKQCEKVKEMRNDFFKSKKEKDPLKRIDIVVPACESVCGDKEDTIFAGTGGTSATSLALALVALLALFD